MVAVCNNFYILYVFFYAIFSISFYYYCVVSDELQRMVRCERVRTVCSGVCLLFCFLLFVH